MRSGNWLRFPARRGRASRSSAWSSRAGALSRAVIWVSMSWRSVCSSVNRWEQRARMAWAALSAGSGDSPSICMIWLRWAMSMRVSSLVRAARWGARGAAASASLVGWWWGGWGGGGGGGVGVVVGGGGVGGEERAAFGAEHALCQELEDFADED